MSNANGLSFETGAIERVCVIGDGVMGRGIANSFARAGFPTTIVSRRAGSQPAGEIPVVASLPDEAPDLVIEAVPEDIAIKTELYRHIEAAWPPSVILATNTSGLPLETLAANLEHPERFVATHYFMPAEVFPLVEVVAGPVTPRAVLDRVAAAMSRTGKDALILDRPVAGFLINRLQHALLHEAYALISSGISNAADIDRIARLLLGPRLSVNGMIEQKDIGGLAAHAMAQTTIVPTFDRSGQPNAYLQDLVAKGETGLDAGRGFYDWAGCDAGAVRQRSSKALEKTLAFLAELDAERPEADRPVDRSPGRAIPNSD